jgi:hypothetical protein
MTPALLRPFFFMIKLDPMKKQDPRARHKPTTLPATVEVEEELEEGEKKEAMSAFYV